MALAIDHAVLDGAISGNALSLNALASGLRPHIERQLARYPVTDEDRSDLVQNTLLTVVRKVGSFRGDSSFSTWLFRVTANEALMLMRSQRRSRARLVEGHDLEDLGAIGEREHDPAVDRETAALVHGAMEVLSDEDRRIVSLYYFEDLGLIEIAGRIGMSESAVRSRLHRSRARLRETVIANSTPMAAAA